MCKRLVTEREEEAYRLICPDFEGLDRKTAATRMGITEARLSALLKSMEKKAPQLFPLLTKLQNRVYNLVLEGIERAEIADRLEIDIRRVDEIISQIHALGKSTSPAKTIAFEPWMENKVKERF